MGSLADNFRAYLLTKYRTVSSWRRMGELAGMSPNGIKKLAQNPESAVDLNLVERFCEAVGEPPAAALQLGGDFDDAMFCAVVRSTLRAAGLSQREAEPVAKAALQSYRDAQRLRIDAQQENSLEGIAGAYLKLGA